MLASLAQSCTEERTEEIGEGTSSGLGSDSRVEVGGKVGMGPDQRKNQYLAIVPGLMCPGSRSFQCRTLLGSGCRTHSCGYPAGTQIHRREILKLQVRINQNVGGAFQLAFVTEVFLQRAGWVGPT